MPVRRWFAPSALAGSAAGTSSGGNSNARFPGDDFSKISPSLWLVWREAFLIFVFISLFWSAGPPMRAPPQRIASLNRPLQRVLQRSRKSFNFRPGRRLLDPHHRLLG